MVATISEGGSHQQDVNLFQEETSRINKNREET